MTRRRSTRAIAGRALRRGASLPPLALALALALAPAGCGDADAPTVVRASDIPVAHTPPGGYGDVMPPPILALCTEPLADGAPDLRGLWTSETVTFDGEPAPADAPLWRHVERIEQCGDRVVVTSSGVIHDMRADGTVDNGVHDVSALNFQPITVVATFEDGALVLRPVGIPGFVVTRARDGDALVWSYGPTITVRMRRVD
ncbi:MAG: hypothetical protein AB1689_19185 [Thermodesulfobacteriota bacterium]